VRRSLGGAACAASVLALVVGVRAGERSAPIAIDLDRLLERVSARVEHYFERAQSLVSTESVLITSFGSNLVQEGFPRRLVYELRVAWDPATASSSLPEATLHRDLVSVNGRPPKPNEEPKCTDPKNDLQPVSPESLSMLLAANRKDYLFAAAGTSRLGGRTAVMIDFKSTVVGPPEVKWKEDCVSLSLPGRTRGRIWIDSETADVLRIDERLSGMFDFRVPPSRSRLHAPLWMSLDRFETSTRYKPVVFHDPEETLVLPASIERTSVFRGPAVRQERTAETFSDYRRFLADSHIVQ
jgi:hypothetical protein